MKFIKPLFIFSLLLLLASCGDDDDSSITIPDDMGEDPQDQSAILNNERDETVATLTENGLERLWRFSQATLTNDAGTFEIINNFNVRDDEFVFSGTRTNGVFEWRPGNDINVEGATNSETLLDFYIPVETSSFVFDEDSSTSLTALNGNMELLVVDENTITGTLTFDGTRSAFAGETIDFTMTTKQAEDFVTPPESGMVFNEVTSFLAITSFAQQSNSGLIGSYADNSLFITYRNDCSNNNGAPSRTIKYNVEDDSFIERNDEFSDFFTRKINIINNEIIVTGGQNIYTYDLDLTQAPVITPHNAPTLSRFSTATLGDDIYVIGGDLDNVADSLRRINSESGTLEVIATMPLPKAHAGAEFVNDNLYIFSGREAFFDVATITPTSFIYNTNTGEFTTFEMPVALGNSHAARLENLIYIVGDIQEDLDGDLNVDNHDVWIGVYDTLTDEITELSHNLDDSDDFSYVHSMTVFNDNLYVTFGSQLDNNGDPDCPEVNWSILAAPLN